MERKINIPELREAVFSGWSGSEVETCRQCSFFHPFEEPDPCPDDGLLLVGACQFINIAQPKDRRRAGEPKCGRKS